MLKERGWVCSWVDGVGEGEGEEVVIVAGMARDGRLQGFWVKQPV